MAINSISYKNTYIVSVVILLCLTPVVYLGIIKYFLNDLFNSPANLFLFLLYNEPFWVIFMLMTGMEIYRRAIIKKVTRIPLLLLVLAGSLVIAIVGISISPVGPELFSRGALQLIVTNLILGTIVGLAASYKPNEMG